MPASSIEGELAGAAPALPSENQELFSLIYVIEVGLRELIVERLEGAYGPQWMRVAVPGGDMQNRIREGRMYERQTPWVSYVPVHPVYYLDFPDLATLIERKNNWNDAFAELFVRKDITISLLRSLEPLRNKVAHNRRATAADVSQAHAAFSTIEEVLASSGNRNSLKDYARRCTAATGLLDRLQELLHDLVENWESVQSSKTTLRMQAWFGAKDAWWSDDAYLGADLSAVKRVFEHYQSYLGLSRRRGEGHLIEQWVAANISQPTIHEAQNILKTLTQAEAPGG